jgi:hypothetical protein
VKAGLPRLDSINADTPTLLDFSLRMKKQNFSEDTIIRYTKALQTLVRRGYNLNDPENVKQYLADAKMCNGSKQKVANAVTLYYGFQNKPI